MLRSTLGRGFNRHSLDADVGLTIESEARVVITQIL